MKRSKEPFADYLEVSSIEIFQENIQNHENTCVTITYIYI